MDVTLHRTSYPGLDDRITVLRAADEVDAVFVRTERFNVLVDTLATPALCRQALDLLAGEMARRPLLVINSHLDWDHFWGNAALDRQVPIIAHSKAIDRLRDPAAQRILTEKQQEPRFHAAELIAPSITFDGETMALHGGDLTLELIHTPGHTPDHIAVWIPEIRTCLAVDAVEHPIPEVWSSDPNDLSALIASLKRIRALQADYVVLAHGQTADPAIVDANLDYFATLHDRTAGLTNTELNDAGLADRDGLRLQDLVTVPKEMYAETRAFYGRCHQSNLAAMLAARDAGIDPFREPTND
ncbi:MBL fold metallo-hydrolase [Rhizobium sp. AC44/96]|uniref:MBL fold metallo-hydrolase n=1 Tax=unclassified Rhizobium TaxID=2613769 RepID=UPI00080FED65|nr:MULTISPECIES: MBL fold metallo-hydrolase [unclassified Rhizobium]MDM9621869.1 MBL fold metallo-hydrolase [Rhizobium sp. S96]OCJ17155.1 MBL fold metallo-hydrolase [Rhizobium sp. AC44/96]